MARKRNHDDDAGEPQAEAITAETAWQLYAVQAINSLYPRLQNGVDFAWGRSPDDPAGEPHLIKVAEGVTIDEGKVQEAAKKLAENDPNVLYEPNPGLHSGTVKE